MSLFSLCSSIEGFLRVYTYGLLPNRLHRASKKNSVIKTHETEMTVSQCIDQGKTLSWTQSEVQISSSILVFSGGSGWISAATMDSGHSDQTSTFYGLSRWSSRPSTIPKDPPLYMSMDQLISYVESLFLSASYLFVRWLVFVCFKWSHTRPIFWLIHVYSHVRFLWEPCSFIFWAITPDTIKPLPSCLG